jgi:glutamate formiminotransferase
MPMLYDGPCIQCAPNFSEGRDADVMESIVASARVGGRVRVADWSGDTDHNRMVVTLVGDPNDVADATLAMAQTALERIDLSRHQGVHPRLGAIDVLPFIPLSQITLSECADLARSVGRRIAEQFDLPVFLYESAAEGRSLPSIRQQAFAGISPDFGPNKPHPTGGAVVVGARMPLIAFNVNLGSNDLTLARKIARDVREAFPGRVRALGMPLASRGIVQVSMNVVRPAETSLPEIVEFISARAPVLRSELIGAMPGYIAFETIRSALKLTDIRPGQVLLESWPERN